MTKEKLRNYVITNQRHNDRAVTPYDVKDICSQLSFVSKVQSEAVLKFVYIYVLTTDGSDLSQSQKSRILELISPKVVMGFLPNVSSVSKVRIVLDVNVYLSGTYSKLGAESMSTNVINKLLDPQKDAEIGDGVTMSSISKELLQNVIGSTNVTFNTLKRQGSPQEEPADIPFIANEVVDMDNSIIKINVIGGI